MAKMENPEEYIYEEYRSLSTMWSWLIVIGLSILLVATGIVVHRVIRDAPRHWDYGAMETIPGASVYSSVLPEPVTVGPAEIDKIPRQIQPLPDARPLEKLKPSGYEKE